MIENKTKSGADFKFEYSAPTDSERKEILSIRNEYLLVGADGNDMERLRAMHRHVKSLPSALSIVIGVIGTLIFGGGMAMFLEWNYTVSGVIVGVIGFVIALAAYPINKIFAKLMKKKYSDRIIELSNEILGEDEKNRFVKK